MPAVTDTPAPIMTMTFLLALIDSANAPSAEAPALSASAPMERCARKKPAIILRIPDLGIFFTVLAGKEKKENGAAGAGRSQRKTRGGSGMLR